MLSDPALSTRIGNSLEKTLKDQGITIKRMLYFLKLSSLEHDF